MPTGDRARSTHIQGREMNTFERFLTRTGMVIAVGLSLAVMVPASSNATPASGQIAFSTTTPAVTGSASTCTDLIGQSGHANSTCAGPNDSTIGRNCIPFPNGMQWQDYVDGHNVPSQWTFSNGSQGCVKVTYFVTVTSTSCSFWFYVPQGHATANVIFGWWDAGGTKHFAHTLNEDPVDGWQQINMMFRGSNDAANVQRFEFQDNNGQPAGSRFIGWGNDLFQHGIMQLC